MDFWATQVKRAEIPYFVDNSACLLIKQVFFYVSFSPIITGLQPIFAFSSKLRPFNRSFTCILFLPCNCISSRFIYPSLTATFISFLLKTRAPTARSCFSVSVSTLYIFVMIFWSPLVSVVQAAGYGLKPLMKLYMATAELFQFISQVSL